MDKDLIQSTLNSIRENYKLIVEIDHYVYIKERFLGIYKDSPKNDVEVLFNKYVMERNKMCADEIERLNRLKYESVSQYQSIIKLIEAIKDTFISLKRQHSGSYSIIPDTNKIRGCIDYEISTITDDLIAFDMKWGSMYERCCEKHIEALEVEAFTTYTGITEEALLLTKRKEMNKDNVAKLLADLSNEIFV